MWNVPACLSRRPVALRGVIRAFGAHSHADEFGQGISVKLDDPSFNAPIFANLFDGEDDTYNLICSRGRRQNSD
jgi:uncharacterized protein (DUF736 family)